MNISFVLTSVAAWSLIFPKDFGRLIPEESIGQFVLGIFSVIEVVVGPPGVSFDAVGAIPSSLVAS